MKTAYKLGRNRVYEYRARLCDITQLCALKKAHFMPGLSISKRHTTSQSHNYVTLQRNCMQARKILKKKGLKF